MKEAIRKRLSDSVGLRWIALLIVSFTMMCGYFVTDVVSPLQTFVTEHNAIVTMHFTNPVSKKEAKSTLPLDTVVSRLNAENALAGLPLVTAQDIEVGGTYNFMEKVSEQESAVSKHIVNDITPGLGWSDTEYGFFSGSYGFINVFLLMLFFGGLILDKMGIRFTGVMSSSLMLIGAAIKWWAFSHHGAPVTIFGTVYNSQVLYACLGFAIFGVGCEITGITVSKVIVKWFEGKELALAMGTQVALARLGTAAALGLSPIVAIYFGSVSKSILLGVLLLLIGLLVYFVYCVLDVREDKSRLALHDVEGTVVEDEGFKLRDILPIVTNRGFWLIALLCLMFYGGVFPFLKFAAQLMVVKYHLPADVAGLIPAVLPFGTIFLTPLFGIIYDKIGKGVTLMIIGSTMLAFVHVFFALPILNVMWFALLLMIILGIAFALVPSAMWPSVPKIIPMKQLGTAYSIIFYIQNIGLSLIPLLIGWVLARFGTIHDAAGKVIGKDYSTVMYIFAIFGAVAIILSLLLLAENKTKKYGLQDANIKE